MHLKTNLQSDSWKSIDNISVRGHAFQNGKIIEADAICLLCQSIDSFDDFVKFLNTLNGQFSILIQKNIEVWIAVDPARNYPLFYEVSDETLLIPDHCLPGSTFSNKLNINAAQIFLNVGYCISDQTLIQNVLQVEAGQAVKFGEGSILKKYYFDHFRSEPYDGNFKSAQRDLKDLLQSIGTDYCNRYKDRQVVIPLSGGLDSRLIAILFLEAGHNNILTFTYGRKSYYELESAQKIAGQLKLEWIPIHPEDFVSDDLLEDPIFLDYFPYAANAASMFYMQDYFALRYLKSKGHLESNAIFVPGHSGDTLTGDHLSEKFQKKHTAEKWVEYLYDSHHHFLKGYDSYFKEQVHSQIANSQLDYSYYENWDMKERQAKFTVNSAKIFNYFGYEYMMPLWDRRLLDFFRRIPFKWKMNQYLYRQTLNKFFFDKHNVGAKTKNKSVLNQLRTIIKSRVPDFILQKLIRKNDPYAYREIVTLMKKDMGEGSFIQPAAPNNYNAYYCQWYLTKVFGVDIHQLFK